MTASKAGETRRCQWCMELCQEVCGCEAEVEITKLTAQLSAAQFLNDANQKLATKYREQAEAAEARAAEAGRDRDAWMNIATADHERAEAAELDAGRLDWIASQGPHGIHVEVCGKGGPADEVHIVSTVFLGKLEFSAPTLREAIDAALRRSAL